MTALLARAADKALDLLADLIHRLAFHAPDPWHHGPLDPEEDRDA
jgi:hypothetical protein